MSKWDSRGMYVRYDLVAEQIVPPIIVARTDQEAIRSLTVPTIKEYPLKDIVVKKIGIIDTTKGEIEGTMRAKEIKWDIYSLPIDNEEAIKPLGIKTKEMLNKTEN